MSNTDALIALIALIQQISYSRLAVFVGGDLPSNLTGLPSRRELAAGLAEEKHLHFDRSPTLAAVAQRRARGGNRWEFTDYLNRALTAPKQSPGRIHRLLAELPAMQFVTTAYDDALKRAFDQAGRPLNHLVRASQLAFRNPAWPSLIQLYGVVSQPDTLVVTEDDQLRLWRDPDKAPLLDRLRTIFEENAVLFVGHDLSDPDFMLLWRDVLDRMGRFVVGAYAIAANVLADDERMWQDRNIRIISAAPLSALAELTAKSDVSRTPDLKNTVDAIVGQAPFTPAPPSPSSSERAWQQGDKSALREKIVQSFNVEELALLCADIEQALADAGVTEPINLDLVGGATLNSMALNLITYLERRGLLDYLASAVARQRPNT